MKKIIYIFLAIPFILFSCEESPVASFSTDSSEQVVGQPVYFNNNSQNSDRYDWDFGDGYISSESEPVHTFTSTGAFEVKLTVTSKNGHTDMASLTLDIVVPTLLVVEVREWDDENVLVPDASVILYNSLADWDADDTRNMVMEGFTDKNGVAVFADLDPFVYYADVYEATHDNWDFRNPVNGVLYIRTPEVLTHQINWFIAWVDIVDHGKGQARGNRPMTIRKIERKVPSHVQPASGGTENWEELYNRRVNK
jgi:hypothetical protein